MSDKYSSGIKAHDFDLNRFTQAQEHVYLTVIRELKNGNKQSHWMWFIFPQINGLGKRSTSRLYSIKSVEEVHAYLNHPVLGARLLECSSILLSITGKSANQIFGFPDNIKLQSCMTLFSIIATGQVVFGEVLSKYFNNNKDQHTIDILHTL